MCKLTLPPLDVVKQYVMLCPESPSGLMYVKSNRFAVAKNGDAYIVLIKRIKYRAARIVFYLSNRVDPGSLLMHKNRPACMAQLQHIYHADHRRKKPKTSKYRGVSWHKASDRWTACISCNTKRVHLGSYRDEIAAAEAYDTAAKQLYGNLAKPNFT